MKSLVLAAIFCVCASAQIVYDNAHGEGINNSGTNQTTISTASFSTTAGHFLICAVRQDTDQTLPTGVTDPNGTAMTHNTASDAGIDVGDLLSLWTLKVVTGATGTATATWAAGHSFQSILCRQYSGQDPTTPIDVNNITHTDQNGGDTSATSGTFTTAIAQEGIIICASAGSTVNTFSAGTIGGSTATNVVADAAAASQLTACEDLIVSSVQTGITASINFLSATGSELSGITIKAAAAATVTGSTIGGPAKLAGATRVQ